VADPAGPCSPRQAVGQVAGSGNAPGDRPSTTRWCATISSRPRAARPRRRTPHTRATIAARPPGRASARPARSVARPRPSRRPSRHAVDAVRYPGPGPSGATCSLGSPCSTRAGHAARRCAATTRARKPARSPSLGQAPAGGVQQARTGRNVRYGPPRSSIRCMIGRERHVAGAVIPTGRPPAGCCRQRDGDQGPSASGVFASNTCLGEKPQAGPDAPARRGGSAEMLSPPSAKKVAVHAGRPSIAEHVGEQLGQQRPRPARPGARDGRVAAPHRRRQRGGGPICPDAVSGSSSSTTKRSGHELVGQARPPPRPRQPAGVDLSPPRRPPRSRPARYRSGRPHAAPPAAAATSVGPVSTDFRLTRLHPHARRIFT